MYSKQSGFKVSKYTHIYILYIHIRMKKLMKRKQKKYEEEDLQFMKEKERNAFVIFMG